MSTLTRGSILQYLQDIMYELFELDRELISEEAKLTDLDIDSIDAVDIMVKIKILTGKRIQPNEFKDVRTVGDAIDLILSIQNDVAVQ
ncbi:MAG: acyl carrier protein [Gammaproteobacteria bacterium]|nr:acyl carrier protein [Gammaproteobacteria bacterium]